MKLTFRRYILSILTGLLMVGAASSAETERPSSTEEFLRMLRGHPTTQDVACLIYSYESEKNGPEDVRILAPLLSNKEVVFARPVVSWPIRVRDIALACIEPAAGHVFFFDLQVHSPAEIISCPRSESGTYRANFPLLSDEEFEMIISLVRAHIKGLNAASPLPAI